MTYCTPGERKQGWLDEACALSPFIYLRLSDDPNAEAVGILDRQFRVASSHSPIQVGVQQQPKVGTGVGKVGQIDG